MARDTTRQAASALRWKVIVTARQKDQGSSAAAKLKNSSFLEFDITDDSGVARTAKQVSELDVLINNAAIMAEGDQDILAIQRELAAGTIAANALGALRVSQKICKLLNDSLGVPKDLIYLNFTEVAASNWGWNGSTFG